MSSATEITRRAKSNLAFALRILPKDRRDDMEVFYAFCRTMDDIADDSRIPVEDRRAALDSWERGVVAGFENPNSLQRQLAEIQARHAIPNELLTAIIDGCRMDLDPRRFETWQDLSSYIWKVACAVGLVSIKLFGCTDPASERYAVALGHALQLTNILRDIGEDLRNGGRVYLPLEDLGRFGYSEQELANHLRDDRFLELMTFEANRAENYYQEAELLIPAVDRHALTPARIMAEIYHLLLDQLRSDGFQVFDKRHRISKLRKLAILTKHLVAG